ncbi:MAG: protein kinase [Desulfobacteraceae bacterium]|nr:MAG: protein kinase [Desulfobacteraceae bacterium]
MTASQGRTFADTSDFFAIAPGDEILVGGRRFLVSGEEREYRFGVEDPKFWVKKVHDCETQERKIIKLAFVETFTTYLGGVPVHCFRDPAKESAILELTAGHPSFMKGKTYLDSRGNPVRVLDIVRGANLLNYIHEFRMPHEIYFWTVLPGILHQVIKAIEAIGILHDNGFRHGDIRNDHLIVSPGRSEYVWIDFDYDFELPENPFGLDIFGLGNLLIYTIGKGFHDFYSIKIDPYVYKDLKDRLVREDFSILHKGRLVNLRKHYPYIPPMLNNILLHFSRGTQVFYENSQEIVEDLQSYLQSV